MTDILFVHANFPGQFGPLAKALTAKGYRCAAIAAERAPAAGDIPVARYKVGQPPTPVLAPMVAAVETHLLNGRAAATAARRLKEQGLRPSIIVGQPSFGEMTFLKEVFPEARIVAYAEYYVPMAGGDIGFDPEFGPWTAADRMQGQAHNLALALVYAEADRIVSPTPFQAGLLPQGVRGRSRIIHEGVDTDLIRPDPSAVFTLPDGRTLDRATPLITFVNRHFEPLRGYHVFMRALPKVLEALPTAQVLLIGGEGRGYGLRRPPPEGWKARFLGEVKDRLDLSRVHFTGPLPHERMIAALQASSAHVYYTYPFVLSWSLLEAMACGALIVGSDTAPVRDVIEDGVNGLLADFFDVDGLAERLIAACRRPADFEPLRRRASADVVAHFDRERVGLPAWIDLIQGLEAG